MKKSLLPVEDQTHADVWNSSVQRFVSLGAAGAVEAPPATAPERTDTASRILMTEADLRDGPCARSLAIRRPSVRDGAVMVVPPVLFCRPFIDRRFVERTY